MGIISQVGRKKTEVKIFIGAIYGMLILGTISVLIPLMVMLTLSMGSVTDVKQIALFPRYIFSSSELFKKMLAEKYNEKLEWVRENYPVESQGWLNWNHTHPPMAELDGETAAKQGLLVADWNLWIKSLPGAFTLPGYSNDQAHGPVQVSFQSFLINRYGDVATFNAKSKMNYKYISAANFPADNFSAPTWYYDETQFIRDYFEFKAGLDSERLLVVSISRVWDAWLKNRYSERIENLNNAWGGTRYSDAFFSDVAFPFTQPANAAQAKDWSDFVKERYPRCWIRVKDDRSKAYLAFLKKKFKSIGDFNVASGTSLKEWSELRCPNEAPQRAEVKFWSEFVATLPLDALELDSAELRFQKMVLQKHQSVQNAESDYGMRLMDIQGTGILLPARASDLAYFHSHKIELLRHFIVNNYFAVGRFFITQGNSVKNTLILVVLSIITALLVNPLAAYALSRFRLNYAPKVLLFLLATAAFPAEVTAIPQFLLIKDLHMLNTFSALVLPGLVSGFWIFMLKGFFDSLPKELYEAAIMEGADEFDLFAKITVPLAAPILALTAFGAFGAAYGGYQWNMIVANDSSMWTLMVSLQQFMGGNTAATQLTMAAFVLASIPTLIAFMMVQKVILKGVVIPTMH